MSSEVISSISTAADLRKVTIIAAGLGVVGGIATSLLGYPLMALFLVIGLSLGLVNALLLRRSAAQFASGDGAGKGRFALGSLGRLGLITVVALAFGVLVQPDGLGVFIGLAVFQMLMVGAALVPLLKDLRQAGSEK
ncbi:MAG TPA: hypothetical protein VGJ95_02940 [Pseudonocardiaceae bacterium]